MKLFNNCSKQPLIYFLVKNAQEKTFFDENYGFNNFVTREKQ